MKLDLKPYRGQHCETTATGTLLRQIGLECSEPMLFGLGEGLSFFFWKTKSMDYPFLGGRIKPDLLTKNIARNLGLRLTVRESSSRERAWRSVKELLDSGKAVGLKLDCYHLEYFSHPIHFAGHYVAIVGYDEESAFLVDTEQQSSEAKTSLRSLSEARAERGSMSSRNLYYVIERGAEVTPLREAIESAIQNNAECYLNPPIKNSSYKGIEKAGREIVAWFDRSQNRKEEFGVSAMLMERAGTGGAIFRNLYRDFLGEAYKLTEREGIGRAYERFRGIARSWSELIALLEKVAEEEDRRDILEASERLKELSEREREAMQLLLAGD